VHSLQYHLHIRGTTRGLIHSITKVRCMTLRTAETIELSLVSYASRIVLLIIMSIIRSKMEFEISDEQAGFRPQRGTGDHIVNLKLITEKAREFNTLMFLCFINFTKALIDSVRLSPL